MGRIGLSVGQTFDSTLWAKRSRKLWELWNEPDSPYWGGTVQEYCKLYDYSADAVRRALPTAKIGSPHVTGPAGRRVGNFLKTF